MLIIVLSLIWFTFVSAAPSPFLGLGQTSSSTPPTPLAQSTISSTLLKPAQFSQIAYCSIGAIRDWTCGKPCESLPGIKVLLASGDNADIPDCEVHSGVEDVLLTGNSLRRIRSILPNARRSPSRHRPRQHVRPFSLPPSLPNPPCNC